MGLSQFVCTLPAAAAGDPRAFAARAQAAGADLLEIRGDLTPGLAPFESPLPLLLAPRGRDLGRLLARGAAWLDVELEERVPNCPGARRLGSWHDHAGTPALATLLARAEALRQAGAEALKLVTTPRSAQDLWTLEQARERLIGPQPVTLLGMGPLADSTRLLSPWRNAFTYAAVDAESRSAPGQWTLAQHQAYAGERPPRITGLLGGAAFLERSLSPRIHALLARRHGVSSAYLRFPSEAASNDLEALLQLGVAGLSVTAPHKLAAAQASAELDGGGRLAGAVNTLVRVESAERLVEHTGEQSGHRPTAATARPKSSAVWHGFQLDRVGLIRAYADWRGSEATALIGSGGAAAAVLLAARELDWRGLRIFARNRERAAALGARFGVPWEPLEALSNAAVDLLISSLPVDLAEEYWPRPQGPHPRALDLRYQSPLESAPVKSTGFEQAALQRGFEHQGGLPMLIHQALAQFELFHGLHTSPQDLGTVLDDLTSGVG